MLTLKKLSTSSRHNTWKSGGVGQKKSAVWAVLQGQTQVARINQPHAGGLWFAREPIDGSLIATAGTRSALMTMLQRRVDRDGQVTISERI